MVKRKREGEKKSFFSSAFVSVPSQSPFIVSILPGVEDYAN